MVGDNHKVANLEIRIHSTGGIAYKQGLYAQFIHHTNGEGDLFHGVALIVVETAFHGHNVLAAQLAENQLACVAFNCRYREIGYITI